MRRIKFLFAVLLTPVFIFAQQGNNNPEITKEEVKGHISYLASDEMEGRFSGSEKLYEAADYIKNEFESYGLKPLFDGSYMQEFKFLESIKLTGQNNLEFNLGSELLTPQINEDYTPLAFSGNTGVMAELVFAGYGISAPDLNYDDYAGIDVNGKVVLVMRYHPEYDSAQSKFDSYASFRRKASTAKEKGAAGIIFVSPYKPVNDDKLTQLRYDGAPAIPDFTVLQIKRGVADKLFDSQKMNFEKYQSKIDADKKPASFIFKDVKLAAHTELEEVRKNTVNVAGYLEGNDPKLKNEYIVIGGHFDHLGYGAVGSRYQGKETLIHNGADDNASGTTGVLEIAEKFGSVKNEIRRSIIFITFSGEELGLLGSNYFVNNTPVKTEDMAAMINMDMIGRINEENNLTVIGVGTSSLWKPMMNRINEDYNFKLGFNDSGFGGSDHMSFSMKKVPVLFFFTGIHEDYHMPSDDTEKINFEGEQKIINFVFDAASELAVMEERPDFIEVKETPKGGTRSSRIKVGTIPEFAYEGQGYKISGVTPGSPAEKAGLKANDIITKFAGVDVANIYDFMNGMSKVSPGDTVECVVKRGDEEMTFQIELVAN